MHHAAIHDTFSCSLCYYFSLYNDLIILNYEISTADISIFLVLEKNRHISTVFVFILKDSCLLIWIKRQFIIWYIELMAYIFDNFYRSSSFPSINLEHFSRYFYEFILYAISYFVFLMLCNPQFVIGFDKNGIFPFPFQIIHYTHFSISAYVPIVYL